jgi:hypothetical protein
MPVFLPILEMSSSGNTWEGYQWVDGWPVTPPLQQTREPVQADEGEMAVETDSAAEADKRTATSTDDNGHVVTKQSETSYQVNDFVSSHAGSTYTSEDETDDDIPDEKQVDLGSGYSQCRAAREAAFLSTVVDISCNENMLGTETKK